MNSRPKIPEKILSRIWEEHRFQVDSLRTATGLEVQVIRRGRRNTDNGPDFKNALIRIGEQVYEGDVELHLEMTDWYTHGHETDPSYAQTVLHVVLWPPNPARKDISNAHIRKANGEYAPTVFVFSALSLPIERLIEVFQRADERKQQKIRQCQNTLKEVPLEHILCHLKQLGQERLSERTQRFELWLPTNSDSLLDKGKMLTDSPPGRGKGWVYPQPDKQNSIFQQLLYEAICEGFGYSSNKRPFVELARRLPLNVILSHLPKQDDKTSLIHLGWIQALLFGTSGLLPEGSGVQTSVCPETEKYLTELRSLWEMLVPCLDVKPMKPEAWHFFRLRPPNFPTRRLAVLSYLILNYRVQPLFESYLQLFELISAHPDRINQSVHLLERTLEIPAAGYWKGRYLFGKPVFPDHDHMFLGQSRIRDILISAVFPVFLLYALHTSQPELKSLLLDLYDNFPSPSLNRVTKKICAQLFAHRKKPLPQIRTAVMYQGMLQLYKHYCHLPACTSCPECESSAFASHTRK